MKFEDWLRPDDSGLFCVPGRFHVDPSVPVDRAVITHGHSDHARAGHASVLSTPETGAIMRRRLGADAAGAFETLGFGKPLRIGDVEVRLVPAGHVLGSAQVVIDYRGRRAVISGDYKRQPDPTCAAYEPVPCDLFVTEATFGLPVFRHGDGESEMAKALAARARNPDRTVLVGAYGLGKAQRVVAHLRALGYDRPVWLHGAVAGMCDLYRDFGIDLGPLQPVSQAPNDLAGEIVVAPPGAMADIWSRRLADPIVAFASGWMRVRGRARQRGVELPLVISDHCDWPDLIRSIEDSGAEEVWITHGREDALIRQLDLMGRKGRALRLVGREDEAE